MPWARCWTGKTNASGFFQQAAAEGKNKDEQDEQNDHWIRHLAGERIGYVNWRQIFLIGRLYDSSKTLRFAKSIYTRNQLCLNMLILTYVPHVEGLISLPPPRKTGGWLKSVLCAVRGAERPVHLLSGGFSSFFRGFARPVAWGCKC
jgi:hypothetical protein